MTARRELTCGCGVVWSLTGGTALEVARWLEAWEEAHQLHRRPVPDLPESRPDPTLYVAVGLRTQQGVEPMWSGPWAVTAHRTTRVPLPRVVVMDRGGEILLATTDEAGARDAEAAGALLIGDDTEGPERLDRDADIGP